MTQSPVVIREIDLSNIAETNLYLTMQADNQEERWGGRSNFTPEEYRNATTGREDLERRSYLLLINDEPVGSGYVSLHAEDNADTVYFGVYVAPAHREHERMVLQEFAGKVQEIASEAGRPRLESIIVEPASGLNESLRTHTKLFEDLGMEESFRLVGRGCPLPLPSQVRDNSAAVGEGYSIILWRDQADEKYHADIAQLLTQLSEDEPSEEEDREIERFDAEKVKKQLDRTKAMGYTTLSAGALSQDGELVGLSFIEWHGGEGSDLVTQEETVVRRDHRGHGLGLAMKIATHADIVNHVENVDHVLTWNDPSNEHMLAINELLGYKPLTTTVIYQTPRTKT